MPLYGDNVFDEGTNLDSYTIYRDSMKKYKDNIKLANKAIKDNNSKEAKRNIDNALQEIRSAKKNISKLKSDEEDIATGYIIEALYVAVSSTIPFANSIIKLYDKAPSVNTGNIVDKNNIEATVKSVAKSTIKSSIISLADKGVAAISNAPGVKLIAGLAILLDDLKAMKQQMNNKDNNTLNNINIFRAKILKNLDTLEKQVKEAKKKIK